MPSRGRLERLGAAECAYAGPQIGSVESTRARRAILSAFGRFRPRFPISRRVAGKRGCRALPSASRLGNRIGSERKRKDDRHVRVAVAAGRAKPIEILTVERALEHRLSWQRAIVSQCEVGRDLATFGDGVRSASRSGADVIFAGELIELDTLEACLEAAENGRFVLAALAGPSETSHALARLIGFFPSERARARPGEAGRPSAASSVCGS